MFQNKNKVEFVEELQLELTHIEKELKWWDLQLKNEHFLAPEQKLELLKKKWAIQMGIKNIIV